MDIPGPGETDKKANDLRTRLSVARNLERCKSEASKRGESELSKKPKLDNARRLRSFCCIDPAVEEFKDIMKNARRKLELPMPAAMPCRFRREEYRETCSVSGNGRQNTHALFKATNVRESAWKELFIKVFIKVKKIILQGEELIH